MNTISIPDYLDKNQFVSVGSKNWRVSGLIQRAKDLPIFDMPLLHIDLRWNHDVQSLKELAWHVKAVDSADPESPIIFGENGELLDGRHRITKALLDGAETIKAVRFEKNPPADWTG